MFAPWCPTCRRRILLGPRRVVALERHRGAVRARLRCFCGTEVWSTSAEPGAVEEPTRGDAPARRELSCRW